jgi:hypothetical protein
MSRENISETISVPFLGLDSWFSDAGISVKCPACGYVIPYVNISRPSRSGIVLTFSGECPHTFEITFIWYKGVTYINAADITADIQNASAFLAERGCAGILNAVTIFKKRRSTKRRKS